MFSKQLVEKVRELDYQKNQTEKAFHGFLPPSLVRDMKHDQVGEIELESYPTVFSVSSFLYNIKYFFSITSNIFSVKFYRYISSQVRRSLSALQSSSGKSSDLENC